jgi:hypothetical protein
MGSMKNLKKIATIVLCIELLVLAGSIINGSFQPAAVLVSEISGFTNQERQQNNLAELKVDPLLSKAAEMKAEDMAKNEYFSHISPSGKTPWFWLELVGYKYDYAGENLAINFSESKDVVDAWMNSPTHRENLLKGAYTEMGTGIATGTYEGKDVTFIVQDYASLREGATSTGNNTSQPAKNISVNSSATNTQVLGAMTQFVEKATIKNILLVVIGALLLALVIFLLIKFVIRCCKKNPIFLNTLLVILAVLIGIYLLYELVFKEKTFVATSTNYAAENTNVIPAGNQ